ncbi:MAG TPA: hypothetical protein VJU61_05745 [Polyangiaceae bacterium]|nr:hypothetical protein [Polyangiaceae bacterium]
MLKVAGTSHASIKDVPAASRKATPSAVAARRETPQRAKPASAADCNPPYFFDENNIQRLKLECL